MRRPNSMRVVMALSLGCVATTVVLADDLSYNESREVMKLAGELRFRYGYLVTYEDAPGDPRDVIAEPRPGGRAFR
jgi:hypothetical protein